jgi:hypothetical protein
MMVPAGRDSRLTPTAVAQMSGTSSPKRSFVGATATGLVGWILAGSLRGEHAPSSSYAGMSRTTSVNLSELIS